MKIQPFITISLSFLLCFSKTNAQKNPRQFEIAPYLRMDWYPEFITDFGGTATSDQITIRGLSHGINVLYKIPIKKRINLKAGIGYYTYSFSKIKSVSSLFGESDSRRVDLSFRDLILLGTDKYKYKNLLLTTSIEKTKPLNSKTTLIGGLTFSSHFNFSRIYHIPGSGTFSGWHKRNEKMQYFGVSGGAYFSILKKIGQSQIGPSLIIPIYDRWAQDGRFSENKSDGRDKWFRGIGIGITYGFH